MATKKIPSKKKIENARAELEQLAIDKKQITDRENEIRTAIADSLHDGEDGTKNIELHGYEVKVTRKLNVSCSAGELARLEDDDPDLYDEVTDHKISINASKAKKNLDGLGDYVTTKQGLPTIKITPIK